MRRYLLNLLTALSLVLCVAVVAMWARSHVVYEHYSWHVTGRPWVNGWRGAYVVRSGRGQIFFDRRSRWHTGRGWERLSLRRYPMWPQIAYDGGPTSRRTGLLGFGVYSGSGYGWPGHLHPVTGPLPPRTDSRWWVDNYHALGLPYWALAALAALLPARWLIRNRPWQWHRQRRMAEGRCPDCGYDLRATPGRCPECGKENPEIVPD